MAQALCDLPAPNLRAVSETDLAVLENRISHYCENYDMDGLVAIAEEYPLPADTLNSLKRSMGMAFLRKYKFNLSKAVEVYGMGWLE